MPKLNFPEERALDELLSDSILTELLARQLTDRARLYTTDLTEPVSVVYTFIALEPHHAVYDVTIEGSREALRSVQRKLDAELVGKDPDFPGYEPSFEIIDD